MGRDLDMTERTSGLGNCFWPCQRPISMSLRQRSLAAGVALVLFAGCSDDQSKVFGGQSSACSPTVFTNDVDDAQKLEDGSTCFFSEVDAGRAVVWDVLVPTVEGDPIPSRYDFNGEITIITTDSSRDTFGSGGVSVRRCEEVQPTDRLPEGVDCTDSSGDGFDSGSLPEGF